MNIVLHSDDINLLSYWQNICTESATVVDDIQELLEVKNSLIIINYSAFTMDAKELLSRLNKNSNRVLVLHRVPDLESGKMVLSLGAKGYGNALMKAHFLLFAIDTIEEGLVWLHPEFTSQLIYQIPEQKDEDISLKIAPLSQREKEVAILLKDGATYKNIAEDLAITPRTVKAHANSIYTKLHVKDRLALALFLK